MSEQRDADGDGNHPVYRPGTHYVCEVPAGSKLLTIGDKILLVAPNMPPQWLTLTGLVPVDMHPPA